VESIGVTFVLVLYLFVIPHPLYIVQSIGVDYSRVRHPR
jgi:hypothetical protein